MEHLPLSFAHLDPRKNQGTSVKKQEDGAETGRAVEPAHQRNVSF